MKRTKALELLEEAGLRRDHLPNTRKSYRGAMLKAVAEGHGERHAVSHTF